jgi:hypothetical protein
MNYKVEWVAVNENELNKSDFSDSDTITMNMGEKSLAHEIGILRLGDFRWFIINSNFNLSSEALLRAQTVEGIETVRIISRYRLKISIGMMFDIETVQSNFTKRLIELTRAMSTQHVIAKGHTKGQGVQVAELCHKLAEVFPNFSMYINPKQELFGIFGDKDSDIYKNSISTIKQYESLFGGSVFDESITKN